MMKRYSGLIHSLLVLVFLSMAGSIYGQVQGQDSEKWEWYEEEIDLQPHTMIITEVMFNPTGGGADYVEVYNTRDEVVFSDSLCLVRWDDDSLGKRHYLPRGIRIEGHSYVVLTTDTAFVSSHFHVGHPDRLVLMASMPPYPNARGTVMLATRGGTVQDHLDYTAQMHSPLLRNVENVALERSDLSGWTNDPENWHSASSASGYGTPTAPNSQADTGPELQVELSSELLSPDGDGYQDELEISIMSPLPALTAQVVVVDAQGRLVRRLMRNGVLGARDTLHWDGLNEGGTPCPRGTYVVLVEAFNHQGIRLRKRRAVSVVY